MRADSIGLFWEDVAKIKVAKEKYKRDAPPRIWEAADYLPNLEIALNYQFDEMADEEILEAVHARDEFAWDIECYNNIWLLGFINCRTGKVLIFDLCDEEDHYFEERKLQWILENLTTITFNGNHYDVPVVSVALASQDNERLISVTKLIIEQGIRPNDVLKMMKVKSIAKQIDHVDLKEVAPLQASLKIYAGRLHTPMMQDLPFKPGINLDTNQKIVLRWYLANDLRNTVLMRNELREQLDLRVALTNQYGVDLRSKSDAQIAEAIIVSEVRKLNGYWSKKPTIPAGTAYRYTVPHYIKYQSPTMNWVLDRVRSTLFIVQENGTIGLPPELSELEIPMGKSGVYRMGIGGLHSTEKKTAHRSTPYATIKDVDFDSFYPKIIIGQQLFPHHLTKNFLNVYSGIVSRRLAAKASGDSVTSNSLKIVINGSFGKLGSPYSDLYAPKLLIQTTITGQLILLMMIERLELAGIQVISANTDGVVSIVPNHMNDIFQAIVKGVERDTGFTTEETQYQALYSRDVNNYIALKYPDPKKGNVVTTKGKGIFANPWHPDNKKDAIFRFHKNPTNLVCIDAIMDLLKYNRPIRDSIYGCKDITKFVTVRKVKNGAVKGYAVAPNEQLPDEVKRGTLIASDYVEIADNAWIHKGDSDLGARSLNAAFKEACTIKIKMEYLGEAIRWYYAKDIYSDIMYADSGDAVPKSKGAKPLMQLPDHIPEDLDYEWYINETESILQSIAYY